MENDFQKVMSTMKEMGHKMENIHNIYAKSVGLNFTAIIVLQLLRDSAQTYTQKDICEKLGQPKQLINSIIKSFWEQGYVELKEAKDRRNKDIVVTDKGKKYALGVLKPMEDAESVAWNSFSVKELKTFVRTMEKYIKVFEGAIELKKP